MNVKNSIEYISTEEKAGQLFFPAAFINDDDAGVKSVENLIINHHIGGLCFFHSRASAATNYESKKKVEHNDQSFERLKQLISHYQSLAKYPLLMSIDAEWGLAMRVENTPQYPYAITLGAMPNNAIDLIEQVGFNIGNDLLKAGLHLNLAPVLDINDNPKNPVIGYRSFGQNKHKVLQKGLAFYRGMQRAGMLGCLKHFPGHGNTLVDSHLGLPVIDKTEDDLYKNELFPFTEAIKSTEIDSVLVGHLAIPALSGSPTEAATLSAKIIKSVLREQLGFKGAVISDALNMRSISNLYAEKGILEWKAFEAGNDMLCFAENVKEGIEKILQNANRQQIDESWQRILKLKEKAGLFDHNIEAPTTGFNFTEANSLNFKLAKNSITLVKNTSGNFPFKAEKKYAILKVGSPKNNSFCNQLIHKPNISQLSLEEAPLKASGFDAVIVALFPPSVKPLNRFGLSEETCSLIQSLSKKTEVTLYLFGNPYVLEVLADADKAGTIVVAYQDFESYQQVAANHFLGQLTCHGKLPVKIKNYEYEE